MRLTRKGYYLVISEKEAGEVFFNYIVRKRILVLARIKVYYTNYFYLCIIKIKVTSLFLIDTHSLYLFGNLDRYFSC